MRVKFWGTRGSLARPGKPTLRYGGNTSCVEVRAADDTLVILDSGTGIYGLGMELMGSGASPLRGHLLIGHTHWDHIQGFPFFVPLFVPGNEWDIYAPGGLGRNLENTLSGQMEYNYFPVTLEQLGASIRYHDLVEGISAIGSFQVNARYLNHPALTLGYRLEVGGASVVYAVDHEPHVVPAPEGGLSSIEVAEDELRHIEDKRHIDFLRGADLVIHDAQYTLAEYPQKVGFGHTPAETALDFAVAAEAKQLALFHHDPMRDDDSMESLVELCQARAKAAGSPLKVIGAAEGLEIEIPEQEGFVPPPLPTDGEEAARKRLPAGSTILIADDDPDILELLNNTLEPEGFHLTLALDGEAALELAHATRPRLVLLDAEMPGIDGLEVCRKLRADPDSELADVPVLMLSSRTDAEHMEAGFKAGVTDYIMKPLKCPPTSEPAYGRGCCAPTRTGRRTPPPPGSRRVDTGPHHRAGQSGQARLAAVGFAREWAVNKATCCLLAGIRACQKPGATILGPSTNAFVHSTKT